MPTAVGFETTPSKRIILTELRYTLEELNTLIEDYERQRLNKRKSKNRYDKFSKNFYVSVQKAFIKISKKDKNRYIVLDNSKDNNLIEKIIFDKFISKYKK